jgi:hypothetical protein
MASFNKQYLNIKIGSSRFIAITALVSFLFKLLAYFMGTYLDIYNVCVCVFVGGRVGGWMNGLVGAGGPIHRQLNRSECQSAWKQCVLMNQLHLYSDHFSSNTQY